MGRTSSQAQPCNALVRHFSNCFPLPFIFFYFYFPFRKEVRPGSLQLKARSTPSNRLLLCEAEDEPGALSRHSSSHSSLPQLQKRSCCGSWGKSKVMQLSQIP